MSRKRKALTSEEKAMVDEMIAPYINPTVHPLGEEARGISRYDKREYMYNGTGTVYLLQLFRPDELVNNRIAAYMVLPSADDSVGFHTHGDRSEEELYVVMHGSGIYMEKASSDSEPRSIPVHAGSVTSVRGEALHAVRNTGREPLIVFVVTTNEPT
ncbi:MAG: hypothetical protein PPP56_07430 [Longimonas sp.]|uniref:hypothetical protein n=1 Tax=Longimonas sp. TaxID=2039626 RepID=UPI00334D5709